MKTQTVISSTEFDQLVAPLVGLPIEASWLGDFTALYLEIGPIVGAYESGRPKGQFTVYLGFDWAIDLKGGRSRSSTEINATANVTEWASNQIVRGIVTNPSLKLEIQMASGDRIRSATREEDSPDWTIHLNNGTCVAVEAGSLVIERT